MRLRALLILTAGLLMAAEVAKDEPIQKELKKLEGTWKIVRIEVNGSVAAPDDEFVAKGRLIFKGDEYWIDYGEKLSPKCTVQLDLTKDPKTIDLTALEGQQKGKPLRGRYAFKGSSLQLCLALAPGSGRPLTLTSKNAQLITLERAKD
jgi:uncharacterized protein (TIGR03067 family)